MQELRILLILLIFPSIIFGCFSRGSKKDQGTGIFTGLWTNLFLSSFLLCFFSYSAIWWVCGLRVPWGRKAWNFKQQEIHWALVWWELLQSSSSTTPDIRPLPWRWLGLWWMGRRLGRSDKAVLPCLGWREVADGGHLGQERLHLILYCNLNSPFKWVGGVHRVH